MFRGRPLAAVLTYVLVGVLWIFLGDLSLKYYGSHGVNIESVKYVVQLIFLLFTASVLFFLLRRSEIEAACRESMLIDKEHQLKVKINEINTLNLVLSDRIEDVEEANFRIIDMASELEVKNSALADQVYRLGALNNIASAIHSINETAIIFDILVALATDSLDADIGYILVQSEEATFMEIAASIGLARGYSPGTIVPMVNGGVSRHVIESGMSVRISEENRPDWLRPLSILGFEWKSIISAPLISAGTVVGALTIVNRKGAAAFEETDLSMLRTIAVQAGTALTNVQVTKEREQSYINIISSLVNIIEANDEYTRGHSDRVTTFAMMIARVLDLPSGAMREIETAARLHDIGKVGVDAKILHKEGRLDDSEYETMKRHPEIGEKIIAPLGSMGRVGKIIAQHHEWFDGTGYPNKLEGRQILLAARIIGVVDAYDAMTSDRPYRKGLDHEVAMMELRSYSGVQFDPYVVDAFENAVA